jgi:hypothetical protein
MAHDRDYFHRRATEARAATRTNEYGEGVEVAGHLALAYAALARRRSRAEADAAVDPAAISVADDVPLMLKD